MCPSPREGERTGKRLFLRRVIQMVILHIWEGDEILDSQTIHASTVVLCSQHPQKWLANTTVRSTGLYDPFCELTWNQMHSPCGSSDYPRLLYTLSFLPLWGSLTSQGKTWLKWLLTQLLRQIESLKFQAIKKKKPQNPATYVKRKRKVGYTVFLLEAHPKLCCCSPLYWHPLLPDGHTASPSFLQAFCLSATSPDWPSLTTQRPLLSCYPALLCFMTLVTTSHYVPCILIGLFMSVSPSVL